MISLPVYKTTLRFESISVKTEIKARTHISGHQWHYDTYKTHLMPWLVETTYVQDTT